jgi:hypothetical protein
VRVRTGFNSLRMCTNSGRLWIRLWTFR